MDIVFHFHFYDHHKQFTPTRCLALYVANINTTWDELDERIESCAEDLDTKYGEHCGLYGLPSNVSNTIGYVSSGIDRAHQDQVMQVWRTIFLNQFTGCVVSDVFDVPPGKDAEIFAHTQHMYQQQQAQQLRTKLNATITTCGSTATVKKI